LQLCRSWMGAWDGLHSPCDCPVAPTQPLLLLLLLLNTKPPAHSGAGMRVCVDPCKVKAR